MWLKQNFNIFIINVDNTCNALSWSRALATGIGLEHCLIYMVCLWAKYGVYILESFREKIIGNMWKDYEIQTKSSFIGTATSTHPFVYILCMAALTLCDGLFHVLNSLGYSIQLFNPTLT